MASVQPVMNQGPPMVEVKNIFFKALGVINYFDNEGEADAIENETAFQQFNRSLECSNKHGCVMLTFNNSFYLVRVSDILLTQKNCGSDDIAFKALNKLEIVNDALPVTPNIISLSHGEEYLAVDTVKGDSAWAVIFKFTDFVNQRGQCRPFCEIRCPSNTKARISSICWNPGDGVNNLVAVNTDDGSLFLSKILGPNNVELNRFADGGIRCCCWSPKGKQLVVGRFSGTISQLRLDLTEAKQIAGPEPGCVPVSILWTQTTQFLIVFHKENFIDFMQLDVPKGAPPTYTNSGDIFISETVPDKCSCYFLQLHAWNVVLTMTNSASDVVVLVKQQQNSCELWIPGDITDNRRAAFMLDSYTRGASLYYGSTSPVVFSEVESYSPMPMVFLLSQRGFLSIYSVVNSDPQAVSMNVGVAAPISDAVFTVARPAAVANTPSSNAPAFQMPQTQASPANINSSISGNVPLQGQSFQSPQPTAIAATKPMGPTSFTAPVEQSAQKPRNLFGMSQAINPRQLGTSTLPSAQDMAVLQKAVEEKRREMTTQLQQDVSLKGLESDDQCAFVISEVRKFEQRLSDFRKNVESNRNNLSRLAQVSFDTLEKRVLASLNAVEDFTTDMVSTTSAQKEEVEVLKERILNHFSQLEYAKSLVERSRDPRYLEHLRSRPMDPASQQKFEEIKKLHNYLKNQVAECRRYFYEQNRKHEMAIDRVSCTQLIYLTLSNHSKIIRRLKSELDNIKERLGLGRHNASFDESDFLAVCEASYIGTRKTYENPTSHENGDEITLNDLTAGISKVKLNRESDRPDKKPVKFPNRKLLMLKKSVQGVTVVKVKADETSWARSPSKSASRPKPLVYSDVSVQGTVAKPSEPRANNQLQSKPPSAPPSTNVASLTGLAVKTEKVVQQSTGTGSVGFLGLQGATQGIDLSAMIKSTMVDASNKASTTAALVTVSPVSSSVTKPTKSSSTVVKPPSSASPAAGSILKSATQPASSVSNAGASPFSQSPTLAGLLAAPITKPSSSSFSISGLSTASDSSSLFSKQSTTSVASQGMFSSPATTTSTGLFSASSATTTTTTTVSSGMFSVPTPPTGMFTTSSTSGGLFSAAPMSAASTGSFSATAAPASSTTASTAPTSAASSVGVFSSVPVPTTSLFSTVPPSTAATAGLSAGGIFGSASPFFSSPTTTTTPTSTTATVSGTGFISSPSISDSANKPVVSSAASTGLFSAIPPTATNPVGATTSATSTAPTSLASSAGLFSSVSASTVSTGLFSTVPASAAPSGLFSSIPSSTPSTTTTGGLFGPASPFFSSPTTTTPASATATVSGTGFMSSLSISDSTNKPAATIPNTSVGDLFSATSTASTTSAISTTSSSSAPSTGLFSSVPASTVSTGLFSTVPATTTAPSGLFSSIPSSTPSTTTTGGLFGSASPFFSLTTTTTPAPATATVSGTGFMSSLSISDSTNKPATTAANTSAGGLFSSSTFGASTTPVANIFGGGSTFGNQSTTTQSGASTTQTTTFGGAFGQSKPAATTTSLFSSPAPATTSVFGGSATFGSSSPFGSSFGGGTAGATTFGSGGGSIFGSSATSTSQSTGFGALAQQGTTTTSAFGASPFGGTTSQQQTSVFGSPTQQKPSTGLFSSSFGSPAATATASVFGGGTGFGSSTPSAGSFSAGAAAGGVAQQGFGFSTPKPAGTQGFGSPGSNPVFGGGATFGSTSPFGSSFASSPTSTFGTTGTSVFGGASSVQNTAGFGALAQQGSTSPGFGSAGSTGFASPAQPQQQPQQQQQQSLFGSPQQQNKPVFGGQAFSSWR